MDSKYVVWVLYHEVLGLLHERNKLLEQRRVVVFDADSLHSPFEQICVVGPFFAEIENQVLILRHGGTSERAMVFLTCNQQRPRPCLALWYV